MSTQNDTFLDNLGLDWLLPEGKDHLKELFEETLDERFSVILAENVSSQAVDDLCHLKQRDIDKVNTWFDEHFPLDDPEHYENMLAIKTDACTAYELMCEESSSPPNREQFMDYYRCEFGIMLWLQLNLPNYEEVMASIKEELSTLLKDNPERVYDYFDSLEETFVRREALFAPDDSL